MNRKIKSIKTIFLHNLILRLLSRTMQLLPFNSKPDTRREFPVRRIAPAFLAILFSLAGISSKTSTAAQVKFHPDDEVVQTSAEKAVAALESANPGDNGHFALGALAIVEAGKRYSESVPRESKTVKEAIRRILADLPKQSAGLDGPIAEHNETYYPALALILLCEFDDQKYESEIKVLIEILLRRQMRTGAFSYRSDKNEGDTSQMQYAALAMFVAEQHQFEIEPEAAKAALNWLAVTQQQNGAFYYKVIDPSAQKPRGGLKTGSRPTPSIQAAGLGSVYLLADLLQLTSRKKKTAATAEELETMAFPPGVSIYVKPRDDAATERRKGPRVNFDRGKLGISKRGGNKVMDEMFKVPIDKWNYYYLYAFERYAYFREETEGNMGNGSMKTWYDDGVYFLLDAQAKSGMFAKGQISLATEYVNTAFAVLFLVRSSEILVRPSAGSELAGAEGFPEDTELTEVNGKIQANDTQQDLNKMMEQLQAGSLDDSDLSLLAKSMRKAINSFRDDEKRNRGDLESFLRTMISDRNYYRRLIAVRFLAGEQDLGNVPALLYALGDPDFRIAYEAHNGLRLISRKIDSIALAQMAVPPLPDDQKVLDQVKLEYQRVKTLWTQWYLKLRPNAKLLD